MNNLEKLEFLEDAVQNKFGKELTEKLTPETALTSIGLDSLDIVELQMYYEDTYNIEIPTSARIITVGDIMALMV